MKAAVIFENGDLDQVQVADIHDAKAGPGEVLLDVHAAALNHLDIWMRNGRPGLQLHMPHVLGSDAVGTVLEVGEGVTTVAAGDTVLVNPGVSCRTCEACARGQQSECLSFGIIGAGRPGTFAELVAVPAENVHPVPEHLSIPEAAALPLAYLTAWRMLFARAGLRAGESVLIHGIGGGVALAGLQLAHLAGTEVFVTSSSLGKLERARELGAAHGIHYGETDVAEAVLDATAGRGVDVILDTVGAQTWPINFQAARKGGRIVHCGVTGGPEVSTNISALYLRQLTVMGSTMGSHEEFRQMISAVRHAQLRPLIDSVEPLANVRTAMGRMEAGEQFGKIVLLTGDAAAT